MIIYVIVYDNCGNGNDEYKLIEAYYSKEKAEVKLENLCERNQPYNVSGEGYYYIEEMFLKDYIIIN